MYVRVEGEREDNDKPTLGFLLEPNSSKKSGKLIQVTNNLVQITDNLC